MTKLELFQQIQKKKSFLCIGLDSDLKKIPTHLLEHDDPILEFNKQIIDATKDLCVAYKPNIAFYEMLGSKGWDTLQKTMEYIPSEIFTIADAKRGDIGNTSLYYANTFFDTYNFDSVTVAPYMGNDSVTPFLNHQGKWVIMLVLTSNAGGLDFQLIKDANGTPLYQTVLKKSTEWGNSHNLMYVVGATRAELLTGIREIVADSFLLIPGVGAQGGSLEEVAKYGLNETCGLLVNSSRGIIYSSSATDFAEKARASARELQSSMEQILLDAKLI
jgi:orotidine-5'-phosphate decarboxylase